MSRTVLITGGSSGIGLAMSRCFAARGDSILWVARSEDELVAGRAAFGRDVPGLAVDLGEPGAADAVRAWTNAGGWTVDVLVNNAGFGTYGWLDSIEPDRELAMLDLHVHGMYRLTRAYLGEMVERGSGGLLFVASASALQPMPRFTTYAASKAFVLQFSESLHEEMRARGLPIAVTCVVPTATVGTGFQSASGMAGVRTFRSYMAYGPDVVAAAAVAALDRNRPRVVPGRLAALLMWLQQGSPPWLRRRLVARELDRLE